MGWEEDQRHEKKESSLLHCIFTALALHEPDGERMTPLVLEETSSVFPALQKAVLRIRTSHRRA